MNLRVLRGSEKVCNNAYCMSDLVPVQKRMSEKSATTYQSWLNPALKKSGKSLKALALEVGMDYTSLWKMARGNPEQYPESSRPKHQNAVKIGEALGDVEGSLNAAGYSTPQLADSDTALLQGILSLSLEDKEHIRAIVQRIARSSPESRSGAE